VYGVNFDFTVAIAHTSYIDKGFKWETLTQVRVAGIAISFHPEH
jgi:hypothetical protein